MPNSDPANPESQPPKSTNADLVHHLTFGEITIKPQVRKRFDDASLAGLAEKIRQRGVQLPLLCYRSDGRITLIDGERRYRAAMLAGLKRVPVRILEDPLTLAEVLARQLSCNLQRDDLNVVERAEGIQQFMNQAGMTAEQAAVALGLSASTVCRTLAVNRLPAPLKNLAAKGALSADAAYLLVRVTDQAKQAALADLTVKGELSRDALASRVRALESAKNIPAKPESAPTPTSSPSRPASAWRMTRTIGPGVAVAISGSGKSLDSLIKRFDAFIACARDACAKGISLTKFLSDFRHDEPKHDDDGVAGMAVRA